MRSPQIARLGLLIICLFAFFWRLGAAPLFDLDEALYVDGARQMILTGDLVTPRLNSRPPQAPEKTTVPFYEKPILIYWLAAASQRVFGLNLLAARLPAALASFLTTGLIALFGIRRFGERAGLLAGLVFATAPLTILDGRQMTTDGLLLLWLTGALLIFANFLRPQNDPRIEENRIEDHISPLPVVPTLCFWALCGVAVLTKGIIGILLPTLILGMFAFTEVWTKRNAGPNPSFLRTLFRDYPAEIERTFRALRPLFGLALFLLITVPWHVLAAETGERDAQGRTFYQEYIIRQHVNRFRGGKNGDTVHAMPFFTYFAYFAVFFFPWAFFTPAALRSREKNEGEPSSETDEGQRRLRRFLLSWFGVVFVFFSISAAKLPTYIAPLYPPAALLVGCWLDAVLRGKYERQAVRGALGATVLAGMLFSAVLIAPHLPSVKKIQLPAEVVQLVQDIMAVLLFGSALALIAFMRKNSRAGIALFVLMVLALVGVGCTAGYDFAAQDGFGPYQRLATEANRYAAQNLPIVYYDIVPRTPSMLYRANYAPREFSREPLLPHLRTFLTPQSPAVIVICSRKTLDTKLSPELAATQDFTLEILEKDGKIGGGWVMLQIKEK